MLLPLLLILPLTLSGPGCSGAGRSGPARPGRMVQGLWHTAGQGETVQELARLYGVCAQDIEEINDLERYEPIPVGRKVFVPQATSATPGSESPTGGPMIGRAAGEGKGSGVSTASGFRPPIPPGPDKGQDRPGKAARFLWPVKGGRLGEGFGRRDQRTHEGIDILAPEGTAVLAAADGLVIYAGAGVRGYGNMIIVRHTGGLVTVYAHNHRNLITDGIKVLRGQVIAEVGQTGRASASHLHFEVRTGDTPVDPMRYVQP